MRAAALFLGLLMSASAARAEDFCSDRPGLATGTCVVPRGTFQVESSLAQWSSTAEDGERTSELALGASLLRFGIGRTSELQLAWTPWMQVTSGAAGQSERGGGPGDAQLGFKALLTRGAVSVAALPFVKLPIARRPIGNRKLEGGLLVPLEFELSQSVGLSFAPEIDWTADADGRGHHPSVSGAVSLATALAPDLSIALDLACARDLDPGGHSTSALAGVSIAWQARPSLQLDVEAQAGLHGDAPDRALIAGFAYRR